MTNIRQVVCVCCAAMLLACESSVDLMKGSEDPGAESDASLLVASCALLSDGLAEFMVSGMLMVSCNSSPPAAPVREGAAGRSCSRRSSSL